MNFQRLIFILGSFLLISCASKQVVTEVAPIAKAETPAAEVAASAAAAPKKSPGTYLICKAKKSRFHYDWDPSQLASGQGDQNSIRFEFRQAKRPAGAQGENLKAGECGWADQALTGDKKASAQVTFKSLSDEATQNFRKLRTGKVFKFPVRHGKNGLQTAPGAGVSVIR